MTRQRMCEIFVTTLVAGWLYSGCLAQAQNPQCPTRPFGDSSNACASTAFVQNSLTGLGGNPTALVGLTPVNGSASTFIRSDGASALDQAIAPTWTGIHKFTNSALFGSGRPWFDVKYFGAVGDGATNDTTAIQNAINAAQASGSGAVVYFSAGAYCVNGGVTVTGTVRLVGTNYTQLSACGANVTTLTLDASYSGVEKMTIIGPQLIAGAAPTGNALTLTSNCVTCLVRDNLIQFGANSLLIAGTDGLIENNVITSSYGNSIVRMTLSGFLIRNKIDQNYPYAVPSQGITISARANTTGYTTNQIVTLSGYNIQASGNCTSGGSPPALQNYNTNITDGTCTWRLVGATTYYGMLYDGGTTSTSAWGNDYSGPYTAGVAVDNISGGGNPQSILVQNGVFGQTLSNGLLLKVGNALTLDSSLVTDCLVAGCAGIAATGTWAGDLTISNNSIVQNPIGVAVASGTNTVVTGNKVYGSSNTGISISANVTHFNITGNSCGTSTAWGANLTGISVAAGTSNHYSITGNDCFGAGTPISDGGSGTNKQVLGNNDANSTISGIITSNNTTASTSVLTGSIITAGGVGVGGTVWATSLVADSGVTAPNYIINNIATFTNIVAPSSPAVAHVLVFADSTDLRFHDKNAAGVIGTTIVASTCASNNFATGASAAGVISCAQPSISNISGLGTGVATALGVNVGTAGSFVVNGGALGSPSSAGTIPAFTLGGTIAGGGNQLNNIIIGTTTPLAGSFTTMSASTSVTSPIHYGGSAAGSTNTIASTSGVGTSDATIFQTGSQVERARIETGGKFNIGPNVAADALLTVMSNTAVTVAPLATTYLHIVAADSANPRLVIDSFAGIPILQARRADGTLASKSAVASGVQIFNFSPQTWGGSTYGNTAAVQFLTTETQSETARGAKIIFQTTPNTTTTLATAVTIDQDKSLTVAGTTTSTSKTTGSGIFGGGIGVAGATYTDTLNIITVANVSTTRALCWDNTTGLVSENGTVGTCTVSMLAAKNLEEKLSPKEGLDIVLKQQPWKYTMKEGLPTYVRGKQIGFVADYVKDERLLALNDDGSIGGFRYEQFTAVLAAAIQEHERRLQKLENRKAR